MLLIALSLIIAMVPAFHTFAEDEATPEGEVPVVTSLDEGDAPDPEPEPEITEPAPEPEPVISEPEPVPEVVVTEPEPDPEPPLTDPEPEPEPIVTDPGPEENPADAKEEPVVEEKIDTPTDAQRSEDVGEETGKDQLKNASDESLAPEQEPAIISEDLELGDGEFTPFAVTPEVIGNYGWRNCSQDTEVMIPNGTITVSCEYFASPGNNGNHNFYVIRPQLPHSVQASVSATWNTTTSNMPIGSGPATISVLSTTGQTNRILNVTIIFAIPSTISPGVDVLTTFVGCFESTTSNCRDLGITMYSEGVPDLELAENTHYTFACTPTQLIASLNVPVESTCTVTALTSLGTGQGIRADSIVSTFTVPGWDASITDTGGTPLDDVPGTYSPSVPPLLTAGESYSFKVVLMALACTSDTSAPVGLRVALTPVMSNAPNGPQVTSGIKTVTAGLSWTEQAFGVAITEIHDPIVEGYSGSDRTRVGDLTVVYSGSGCGTWYATAHFGEFSRKDSHISPVPVLDSAIPGDRSDPPTTDVDENANFDMVDDTLLLTITNTDDSNVDVTQKIDLDYRIPGGTLVGTYKATITVTATGDAP